MIGISKLASFGVFCLLFGVSQSSRTSLRGNSNATLMENELLEAEIEYVSMEDIMSQLEEEYGPELFNGTVESGLRMLGDNTCWHGGQSNQVLTWLGRKWGSCQSMHPCMCGMQPVSMAAWCPTLCRPSCGGRCATPQRCPRGFNIDRSGRVVPYSGTMTQPTYPFWPGNWGQQCYKYPNRGAPGYRNPAVSAPAPAPANSYNKNAYGGCAGLNEVCNSKACCGSLSCSMKMSDGMRYCMP